VLEAAAAAKPLVATDVGGISEIFGSMADMLIAPNDAKALVNSLTSIFNNPIAATEFSSKLQLRVLKAFSIDAMVKGVVTSYQHSFYANRKISISHSSSTRIEADSDRVSGLTT
jgi:glycosyltransferase involved in cell wall biosynthesis